VTYWALAEMVRSRARIVEAEEQGSALPKLREANALHIADPEERQWIEPRLAHLLALAERTARDREDLFSAWRLFFERLAERQPVVMVFEDMQWADASLLDFIAYLLDWSRNHPLFVITLARPELVEKQPDWAARKRNFTSLFLEPLSAAAMEELLSGMAPGLPLELRAKVLQRAEGVPLYAVEIVRMLLDRGLLVREGEIFRTVGEVEALEVPETLHGLIAARLDGLSAEERKVVQDASVLGKSFSRQALLALTRIPEDRLDPMLAALLRK
jgi:predicted ATPase